MDGWFYLNGRTGEKAGRLAGREAVKQTDTPSGTEQTTDSIPI